MCGAVSFLTSESVRGHGLWHGGIGSAAGAPNNNACAHLSSAVPHTVQPTMPLHAAPTSITRILARLRLSWCGRQTCWLAGRRSSR